VVEIRAEWDGEAGVWWCSNDGPPLTTEAPTFEGLVSRVLEIAGENRLAAPGEEIELHIVAERAQSVSCAACRGAPAAPSSEAARSIGHPTANDMPEQAGLPKAL
jgi:hypothetical protein